MALIGLTVAELALQVEGPAFAEIVLHVDDDQGVSGPMLRSWCVSSCFHARRVWLTGSIAVAPEALASRGEHGTMTAFED